MNNKMKTSQSKKKITTKRGASGNRPKAAKALKKKNTQRKTIGAVSSISTAPVAIGNSIHGARSMSRATNNGVVAIGRDFMFTPIGSGTVTTWTLVGGTPLAPVAFGDSSVRQYMQMYQKYRWRRCVVHYITSSPTSSNGDVMFYHQKNRNSVFLNQTSSFLLPYVISDPDTVIGPQWTNHSADLHVQGTWKSTDYGMNSTVSDFADGDIFLLSRTSTTDSPGYVLFDYEIEFAEMQISPRLLSLPLPRAQWSQLNLGGSGVVTVANSTSVLVDATGNNLSGTASYRFQGLTIGDIYKVILDVTNSGPGSWVVATVNNLFYCQEPNGFVSIPIQDGTTLYAIWNGARFAFYINVETAYSNGKELLYGVTGTVTFSLQCWLSLVGTAAPLNVNPNF